MEIKILQPCAHVCGVSYTKSCTAAEIWLPLTELTGSLFNTTLIACSSCNYLSRWHPFYSYQLILGYKFSVNFGWTLRTVHGLILGMQQGENVPIQTSLHGFICPTFPFRIVSSTQTDHLRHMTEATVWVESQTFHPTALRQMAVLVHW